MKPSKPRGTKYRTVVRFGLGTNETPAYQIRDSGRIEKLIGLPDDCELVRVSRGREKVLAVGDRIRKGQEFILRQRAGPTVQVLLVF